jgi:hypothetical protein
MTTDKHKDMKRKYWTPKEEEYLLELYDRYSDEEGNFLAYKVKKKELLSGRDIMSHRRKLERDWNVKTIGSARMIHHKIDYKAIYEAHMNGCTTRQIGRDFGISHQSVRTAIQKYKRVNGMSNGGNRSSGWTSEEDKKLIEVVQNNTRFDGHVMWHSVNQEDVVRSRIAMGKRWVKHLKADFNWDGTEWVPVMSKDLASQPVISSTKVKTTRRTFLWGAFTIESIEA